MTTIIIEKSTQQQADGKLKIIVTVKTNAEDMEILLVDNDTLEIKRVGHLIDTQYCDDIKQIVSGLKGGEFDGKR